MYHALLTNRYLTSRVIPLIAVAAVALCVALVIVVVSVMTGFLDMVKNSGRKLMGDVVVSYPVSGIPHYERLIQRIEKLPEAAAATPVVDAFGLLKMPYPDKPQKQTEEVQFWGIEPISFAKVTGYEKTLYWGSPDEKPETNKSHWEWLFGDLLRKRWKETLDSMTPDQRAALVQNVMKLRDDASIPIPSIEQLREHVANTSEEEWQQLFRVARAESKVLQDAISKEQWQTLLENDPRLLQPAEVLNEGLTLTHGQSKDNRTIVLGMHVSEGNDRQDDGSYEPMSGGYWWMPRYQVTLTTLPIAEGLSGADNAESRVLQVVNEFVSGVFMIDNKRVMIPIDIAQGMLHLDESKLVDEGDPTRVIGVDPARATMVLVRAREGFTPEQLRDAVEVCYDQFAEEIRRDEAAGVKPPRSGMGGVSVRTWLQQQAEFIGPVEKEREMMRTLFSLVYVVCAGLVLAIFWAIVYEKTRDIGILRSVGASRIGISWIFLRYGLVVGALGAVAGFGLGSLIVNKINVIHEALSKPPVGLPIAVLTLATISLIVTIIKGFSRNLLPVVLGGMITFTLLIVGSLALWLYLIGGFTMWDPKVYYFAVIPNEVDLQSAIVTMIGAVVFSLVGAFVPAAKAADTDPVRALRYE